MTNSVHDGDVAGLQCSGRPAIEDQFDLATQHELEVDRRGGVHAIVPDLDGRHPREQLVGAASRVFVGHALGNTEVRRGGPDDCSHAARRREEARGRRLRAVIARYDWWLVKSPESRDLVLELRRLHGDYCFIVGKRGVALGYASNDTPDLHRCMAILPRPREQRQAKGDPTPPNGSLSASIRDHFGSGPWEICVDMNLGLEGKRAFVGGASRGIGLAIAQTFLAEGADVALAARGTERLEETRAKLAAAFPDRRVAAVAADLTDPTAADTAMTSAVAVLGGLDVAVANAGGAKGAVRPDVDIGEWRELWDENFTSAVLVCQAAIRVMSGGALCLIGSIAGLESHQAPLPYNAAKAALVRYSSDLARLLAPRAIRVNIVVPGNVLHADAVWREMLESDPDEVNAHIRREVPLARFGEPEEIAACVVFLCSNAASFVTGACLVADGGQVRA
jgi:3-oxoacyl-[acyl-carrier protein] reductase